MISKVNIRLNEINQHFPYFRMSLCPAVGISFDTWKPMLPFPVSFMCGLLVVTGTSAQLPRPCGHCIFCSDDNFQSTSFLNSVGFSSPIGTLISQQSWPCFPGLLNSMWSVLIAKSLPVSVSITDKSYVGF